ncbi:MAG: diacylglycerol kinase family protein [Agitococcus sp.]|nr:diacylglycerol kinase family protein [Agitococcus sp.]
MSDIHARLAGQISDDEPAKPRADRSMIIILNSSSGVNHTDRIRQQIMDALGSLQNKATVITLMPDNDFYGMCEQAVLQAQRTKCLLVVAGGDGTVNLVAGLCCKYGVVMGIIPLGTFNYFAREHIIPLDVAAAAQLLLEGQIRPITVGYVNQHLFLNNASFGLYTRIIRNREADKSRFGRFRLVAVLSAVATLLRGQRPFAIKATVNGVQQLYRTAMVFVGNNTFQLNNMDLHIAQFAREDRLAVLVLKPTTRIEMALLVVRGALGKLNDETRLEMFGADSLVVESKRRKIDLVVDGEVVQCHTPLSFRTARDALWVVVPKQEPPA